MKDNVRQFTRRTRGDSQGRIIADQGMVWLPQACPRARIPDTGRADPTTTAGAPAQTGETSGLWAELCRPLSLARCILRYRRAFPPSRSPTAGEPISMRKPLTGEPCAGEPHARFGGRGRRAPFPAPISRRLLSDAGCRRPSTSSGRAVTRLHRVPSGAGPLIRLE